MTTERSFPPPSSPSNSPSVGHRQLWLDHLVTLTDDQFTIPGTNVRFGMDAILGLVLPALGDSISGVLGAVVLLVAWREGAPPTLLAKMAGNIALDILVGTVPVAGDLLDVAYKANRRNHTLLRAFQRERFGVTEVGFTQELDPTLAQARGRAPSWLLGAVLATILLVLLLLPIGLLFLVGQWLFG